MTTPVTQQSFDDLAARIEAAMGGMQADVGGIRADLANFQTLTEAGLAQVRADLAGLRVDHLELRAGFAELRATVSELKLRGVGYEQAAKSRFETLTDSIADLRNEYRGHTHE